MENKKYPTSVIIKFLACSLLGIFLFFVPITLNGKSTIPLDHIVNFVLKIPYFKEVYGTLVIIIGVFLPFYKKTWNKNTTSIIFSLLKLLALPFLLMVLFNNGPEFLMNKDVIPFIWNKIVIPVTTIVPVGSIFLSLIISYGLMEFVGVFMRPVMKPIWKTPGRSAIDAVASFVGSYSLALLITNRVYKEGKYTTKEAVLNEMKHRFKPEFLNRIDDIIVFKALGKESVKNIISLILDEINDKLKEQYIKIEFTDKALDYIVNEAYDPAYGARPLKRFVQKDIETNLSKMILSNEVPENSTVVLDSDGEKLIYDVKK